MKLSKHELEHKSLEGKGHGIIKEGYGLEERFSTYGSQPPNGHGETQIFALRFNSSKITGVK